MSYTSTSISVSATSSTSLTMSKMQRLLERWEKLARENHVDLASDPFLALPVTTQTLAERLQRRRAMKAKS